MHEATGHTVAVAIHAGAGESDPPIRAELRPRQPGLARGTRDPRGARTRADGGRRTPAGRGDLSSVARSLGERSKDWILAPMGADTRYLPEKCKSLGRFDDSLYTLLRLLSVLVIEKSQLSSALRPDLETPEMSLDANHLNLFTL